MHYLSNLVILIFIILLLYVIYNVNTKNTENTKNNKITIEPFNLLLDTKPKKIILFYSKSCPYSMEFIPTWEKLKLMKDFSKTISFEAIEEGDDDDQ